MKLSAQEEIGLRFLIAIAQRGEKGSMTIPELSDHEGLSQPHVAKVLAHLKSTGYVTSTRGQLGGYRLARPASEIVIGPLMADMGGRLFDEEFCDRHSGHRDQCAHFEDGCSLRALWSRIQSAVDQVTHRITLEDLLTGKLNEASNVTVYASRNDSPSNDSIAPAASKA